MTLYVSNEIGELGTSSGTSLGKAASTSVSTPTGANQDTAFRFAREGQVNVFYWVEGPFGYAISADADRAALARVSGEVYRQLNATVR